MPESDGDPRGHPASDDPPEPHPVQERALLRAKCRRNAQGVKGPGPRGQQPERAAGGGHSVEGANHPERELQSPGSSSGGAQPVHQAVRHQRLQEPAHRLPRRLLLREAGSPEHADRLRQRHRAAERRRPQASRPEGGLWGHHDQNKDGEGGIKCTPHLE